MTKELKEIILAKCDKREKAGYETLADSDVMDIIEECKRREVPCTRKELIEAGIEREEE